MNKVSIILKYPKRKKSPLILMYTCEDGVLKYAIGISFNTKYWDKDLQLPVGKFGESSKEIRERVAFLGDAVENYYDCCKKAGKKLIKSGLKAYLLASDGKVNKVEANFFDKLQDLIRMAEKEEIIIPGTNRPFTKGTIANWMKIKKILHEFNPKLTFEGITKQTNQEFINFCNAKGYSLNYTGTLIKDWKSLMNHARVQGWHSNNIQDEFEVLKEETSDIYLTEADIDKLKRVKLEGAQDIIRDRFILGLRTGLRISDWMVFEKKAVIHDGIATLFNKKTGKKVAFPLPSEYYEMTEKYQGKLPKQYGKEHVNREIKKIARKAGIIEPILVSANIGGKRVDNMYEKCDLISTHTGRRSAVSLLLKEHDSLTVESLVGMSADTVRRYDKRTKTEIAEAVKNSSFYNRKQGG